MDLMCRSIKVLRRPASPVTPEEISAASLQFVRKVSGFRKPSKSNQAAFDAAVLARRTIREGESLTHVSLPDWPSSPHSRDRPMM